MENVQRNFQLRLNAHARVIALRSLISLFIFFASLALVNTSFAQIVGSTQLNIERRAHTATLLDDGKVLIVGGDNQNGMVGQAELLDPVAQTSALGASLTTARTDHSATKLADGRVLIIGGRDSNSSLTSSEIYDPSTATFAAGPSLTTPRSGHTATVLSDGTILIAGGDANGSAEVYDPLTQVFSLVTGSMNTARRLHSAIVASTGQVLIVGGLNAQNTVLNTAEVYDPASQSFYLPPTDLKTPRALATLKLLSDGKIQVIGGDADSTMEVFDPDLGWFNALALLPPTIDSLNSTLSTQSRAALISPTIGQDQFLQGALTPEHLALLDRADHSITELPAQNQALVAGGINNAGQILNTATLVKSSSASITTDKTDYAPGSVVTITGKGFQPNESVNISLHETPEGYPDPAFVATADDQGNFTSMQFSPQTNDLGRTFTLTAVGQSSGFTAQTAFTDAADGAGTMTVSPTIVLASTPGNTFTFTFTNTDPAAFASGSQVRLNRPSSAWTGFQYSNPANPGYVSVSAGTCTGVSINVGDSDNSEVRINQTCASGSSLTITYSNVTAPPTGGNYTFLAESRNSSDGTQDLEASPVVTVVNLTGSGTMTVSPNQALASSPGNTFTFTFTNNTPYNFIASSRVRLNLPGGWTGFQYTTPGNPGYVSVNSGTCSGVSIESGASDADDVEVNQTCASGQSFTITYSNVTAPSPSSTTDYTFTTQSRNGTASYQSLAVSPVVTVVNLTGSGTMTVSPGEVFASSTGNTFTFTFTNNTPYNFIASSRVRLNLPGGWTGFQYTTPGNPGYVSVNSGTCSGVSIESGASDADDVEVNQTCASGQSFAITYSNVTAPSPSSTTNYTFTTQSRNGTASYQSLAVSPVVRVVSGGTPMISASLIGGAIWTGPTPSSNGAPVTVAPGANISSLAVTVQQDDFNWRATCWWFGNTTGVTRNWVNTIDFTDPGMNSNTFDIQAPLTPGQHNLNIRVRETNTTNDCGSGTDDMLTLVNAVSVQAGNTAPVVAGAGGTLSYTEGDVATVIDSTLTVTDVDNANLASASVTISTGFVAGEDQLACTAAACTAGGIVVGGTAGALTLTGPATIAQYEAALESVTYVNLNGDNPNTGNRTVTWVVNDGALNSAAGVTSTITVTAVNDPPAITLPGGALSFTEGDGATVIDSAATATDGDSANFDTGTLTVDYTANGSADDRLAIRNEGTGAGQIGVSGANVTFGGVTIGSFTGGSGTTALVVTLNASATPSAAQALMRNITFANVSDNPSTAARTVRFTLTDGDGGTSNHPTKTINVTAVNDPPVVAGAGGTLNYTEGDVATVIDSTLTVTDVDNANLASASVTISTGFVAGEDQLACTAAACTAGGAITVGGTAGALTLTGTATKAQYEAALESVTYVNLNGDNPNTGSRTVTWVVNDGTANSVAVTSTITVTPVNDPPVVAGVGGTLNYTEGDAATVIDASLTVTDVDNANLASASVTISTGFVAGEDQLACTAAACTAGGAITVGGTAGALTLTGTATKAQYEAALESVTYVNLNGDNPNTGSRTVTWVVNDGTANSVAVTSTITVTAVNDAPVVINSCNLGGATPVSPCSQSVQYSDPIVSVRISATDVDSIGTSFIATTQWKKNTGAFAAGLPTWVTLTAIGPGNSVIPGARGWTLAASTTLAGTDYGPGTYIIRVSVSDGSASGYTDVTITVTPENANATFLGLSSVTVAPNASSVVIPLSWEIRDITADTDCAVVAAGEDCTPGDIRNARVSVHINGSSTPVAGCSALAPTLPDSSNTKVGTITCNWTKNIGSNFLGSDDTVSVMIGNYYTGSGSDNVHVSPSLGTEFITGGGYIRNVDPRGQYAGESGLKTNWGFNIKYNKKGTNLQGNLNAIVRNNGTTYQIKTNATQSLTLDVNTGLATFIAKCNITDITNPLLPNPGPSGLCRLDVDDNGEPGNLDWIGFSMRNTAGNVLYFSSNGAGASANLQQLLPKTATDPELGNGNISVK